MRRLLIPAAGVFKAEITGYIDGKPHRECQGSGERPKNR